MDPDLGGNLITDPALIYSIKKILIAVNLLIGKNSSRRKAQAEFLYCSNFLG
jgi:hypothetical protein